MTNKEIDTLAKKIKALKIKIEALESEKKELEETLKHEMSERDTEELVTNSTKVRWTPVKRIVFDSKAFKVAHFQLFNDFTYESISRRFSIA